MTAIQTEKPSATLEEQPPKPPSRDWKTTCLNCGSSLSGAFCAECGQRAAPPNPTLRELGGEAFAEFSGWDGKVAETIRSLIRAPGRLTVEFLEGRRARFVSPLRLYLTCSVLYFLVAASVPTKVRSSIVVTPGVTLSGGTRSIVDAGKRKDLSDADRKELERAVDKAPRIIRPVIQRVSTDASAFQLQVLTSLPKALFALVPVFAGIVAIFYRKRHFAEHLYFALNLHSFIFVALIVSAASKLVHSVPFQVAIGIAVLGWVPIYTYLALRCVYASSPLATVLKEIGIGVLYTAASIPAIVILAIWVASH